MHDFRQVDSGKRLSKSDDGYYFINEYFPQHDKTKKILLQSTVLDLGSEIYETLKQHEAVFHRNCYKKVSNMLPTAKFRTVYCKVHEV